MPLRDPRTTNPSHGRLAGAVVLFFFLVVLPTIGRATPPAMGQTVLEAAMERRGPVSPEKRQMLYRQLHQQAAVLQAQEAVVKTVAKLAGPTVVHIEADVSAHTALTHGPRRFREEAGSGVTIQLGEKFYVLTNRHVIHGAAPEKIDIHLADGRAIHPKQVWSDPQTDVAVLAVAASGLVAASLGDSDQVEIGDFVLAVGSPFGLSHSVTFGIVSAKGRRKLDLGASDLEMQDFLQTDAAINPGNSGGPLINLQGEVIGINTAIASNSGGSEGIGFAIPIKMFMFSARQLVATGKVRRAFLGVSLDLDFGPSEAAALGLPRPFGTRVTRVYDDSPAQAAGIEAGDVILQFDGVTIEDDNHLVNMVRITPVGTEVPLVVYRGQRSVHLKAVLSLPQEP